MVFLTETFAIAPSMVRTMNEQQDGLTRITFSHGRDVLTTLSVSELQSMFDKPASPLPQEFCGHTAFFDTEEPA